MAESPAPRIVEAIGGSDNITGLTHCATRLRFELADANRVDQSKLETIAGVLGAVPQSGNRYQVVIGGAVASVYEDIMRLPSMNHRDSEETSFADSPAGTAGTTTAPTTRRMAWLDSFFEYLSDSFRPILGVLLGASIIITLVNLFISVGAIHGDEGSTSLMFIKAIWKGVFYFLPIMVAYNASKKLKVDPWLGGAIMAMLMTPQFADLMNARKWKGVTLCSTNSTLGTTSCTTRVFGLPMLLNDYSGNVFVPLLMAAALALVYHGLKRIIPEGIQLVFVPFFSMIIVGSLTAFVIGPIGVIAGSWLGVGLSWMNLHAPFVFAVLIPMLYPFLVPLGLHWPLNALMLMNIQTLGYDFIQAPMGVWNFSCFGATAGVLILSIRDGNKEMRQTSLGALAAGLLGGISEPSLYGIHLRYKLVYKRLLIGCAAGGITIAVMGWLFPSVVPSGGMVHGVTTSTFAFASLLTIPVFSRMWVYAVSIAVAFLVSMSLIVTLDYRTPEQRAHMAQTASPRRTRARTPSRRTPPAPAVDDDDDETVPHTVPMPSAPPLTPSPARESRSPRPEAAEPDQTTERILAPIAGHVTTLAETGDPVFASGALGEGVAVIPTECEVRAPVGGVVRTAARTGHVFGIKTDTGVEVLIHIGIDTVRMGGVGFTVTAGKGDRVRPGDLLATVDFAKIAAKGHGTATIVTVTNTTGMRSVTPLTGRDVRVGDPVIEVIR
ncbi:MAG: glucose PTS transporter subunit IIA [Bifidobacterium sp.]|jgi:PTS system beta-glucosides-specific IIC component|nr:glucose PTS transporter subunit IIA [Bifidobacterium sp.]